MRLYDLKEYLFDLVSNYFTHANVVWTNEVSKKPALPAVTLTLRNPRKASFPMIVDGRNDEIRAYQCSATLEINIFSKGGKVGGGYSDDTMADMMDFLLYLSSPEILDEMCAANICIDEGNVQPIPTLLGESKTEFRTMAELDVHYIQLASGAYGVKVPPEEKVYAGNGIWKPASPVEDESEWKPTSAGGGAYDYVSTSTEIIEEAETEEVKNNG